MNNKRLIALTTCWILAVVVGLPVLSFAGNESGINKEAQQHFEKANELRKVSDYDAAVTEYKKTISMSPNSKIAQDAQYWIGQSYFEAKKFDAALSAFQKILDEYPASPIIPSTKKMIERAQQAKWNKSLFEAAWDGDVEQVRLLISQGADVNARNSGGSMPIHSAAWAHHADIVELLIKKGAEVDAKNRGGYTSLYYAVWLGDTKTTRVLVANGADLNYIPEGEWPPLYYVLWRNEKDLVELMVEKGSRAPTFHLAAFRGDLAKAKSIYAKGMDVDARDQLNWTPLHWASSGGQKDVAEFLISKGADVKAETKYQSTPLNLASTKELVELLLSKGLSVNETSGGSTPLHCAAKRGYVGVAEAFISHGADIEAEDGDGRTPLHAAVVSLGLSTVEDKKKKMVEFLIAKGASVNTNDNQGRSALMQTMQSGHTEIVELLRQHGAKESLHDVITSGDIAKVKQLISEGVNINTKARNGQTPLHLAAYAGRKNIVELLLDNGADIEARNRKHQTPLNIACQRGNKEIVELLIENNANIGHTPDERYGSTALHIAAVYGLKDIIEYLIEKGADVEAKNSDGGSPLGLIAGYGTIYKSNPQLHNEIIELLIDKGANIETRSYWDCTPLYVAVLVNRHDVAELLLNRGAKIDVINKFWGTIAHGAMRENLPEFVSWSIEKGVDIPQLHQAAYFGDIDKVKSLISNGGDVNQKDIAEFTALHCATLGQNKEIAQLLIDNGANIEARNCGDRTPLYDLCHRGYLGMVKLLIENGANVNTTGNHRDEFNSDGIANDWTPLHVATHVGRAEVAEYLLTKGADIQAKCTRLGHKGLTALHLAARHGHLNVVKILLAKGADINARTDKGSTALSLAQAQAQYLPPPEAQNYNAIVQFLHEYGAKE